MVDIVRPAAYTPFLVLPQYVNDCFLGETIHLSVMLCNPNKAAFTNVKLKVEIAREDDASEPFVLEAFSGVTLEPHKKPHQTTVTYVFKQQSQYRSTFVVTFNVGKKSYQVVRRATWVVANPFKVDFVPEKDTNGRTHLEATLTNTSKLNVALRDVKLVTPDEFGFQDSVCQKMDDVNAVCVLPPNGAYSVIFKNIKTSKPSVVRVWWHSYERGVGEVDLPVDVFNYEQPVAYEVMSHPGTVAARREFSIKLKVTNTSHEVVDCRVKFNEKLLRPLAVQVDDYLELGGLGPAEFRVVEVPMMSMTKGFHTIQGIEIHASPDLVVPVTDMQVLAV
ncbi:trafficking protein particle complex subunit 13, putative [Babesia caballi]|uniref:Trafficking protein particle complex subunit 13, putative n=1 Tax=Babesia caballi TaxID=5871 RepID=A0AAV4LZR4_BABCB|nr:trafficking protein particle complex subunit 13, putative [Babesia caballi]